MRHAPFASAERFDRSLGDPNDPHGVFSYRRSGALDRREEFPTTACANLDVLGLPRHYVPADLGGALEDYEELMMLIRVLARRDLTLAVAHAKTGLGAVCVWIGGEHRQAKELAVKVLGGDVVSLALTERAHGSDLLAGETSAEPTRAGFRIHGDKWLINNATRARLICLLARTDRTGGPRGFSLILVDKHDLAPGSYRPLPAARTHGIRGADISGISFTAADVGTETLVGEPGAGLEIVLKSMQLTRTMCGALSLGAADHALRVGVDFASRHRLFDRNLIDLGPTIRTLAEAYADLLIAEAVTLVSTRSIHTLPGELSVASAAVKYWVPTTVDGVIVSLSRVLGARALLTEDFADGRFQKLQRDHQIVGIFDGNTYVNLTVLINQFPALARAYRHRQVDGPGLVAAATLRTPPARFDRARLRLLSRAGCSLVQAVPEGVQRLLRLAEQQAVPASLGILGTEFLAAVDELHRWMAAYRPSARDVPADAFALATRYAQCYAGAACLHLWLHNHAAVGEVATAGLWADGVWLAACLARVLARLRPSGGQPHRGEAVDPLSRHLIGQHREGLLFSLLPCELTGERRAQPDAG